MQLYRRYILPLLALFTLFCGCEYEPDARIQIIKWDQPYYRTLGGWSDLVEIWYEIENTGSVEIDYYEIWFMAKCKDGSTYEDWTNGINLDVGRTITDYTFIDVPNKEVLSVMILDYELTTY